jgi:diadenosine tetraphosphate (Ap4A) HIT family hydrolase
MTDGPEQQMDFALDPRLAADTRPIGDLALCRLLLMDDETYPWLILVPRHAGAAEILDLSVADRARLIEEIALVCDALRAETRPIKLNVAALGNVVRQWHVHLIARFETDPAWPGPVWGRFPPRRYGPQTAGAFARRIAARLGQAITPSPEQDDHEDQPR